MKQYIKHLSKVLNYLEYKEKLFYENTNQPAGHIYCDILEVRKLERELKKKYGE